MRRLPRDVVYRTLSCKVLFIVFESAEKALFPFEKEGLRGIIELKFLFISL